MGETERSVKMTENRLVCIPSIIDQFRGGQFLHTYLSGTTYTSRAESSRRNLGYSEICMEENDES